MYKQIQFNTSKFAMYTSQFVNLLLFLKNNHIDALTALSENIFIQFK